ncbi:MAG: ribonuclease Y [Parcubacteria group bacterium]|nr:ribonuclease Y [Parcubacteria group bacterium]
MNTILLVSSGATLVLGLAFGYFLRKSIAQKQAQSIEAQIEHKLNAASTEAKEILIEAKTNAVKILEEAKREEKETQVRFLKTEERLSRREEQIASQLADFKKREDDLGQKIENVKQIRVKLETLEKEQSESLERTAQLTQAQAKDELFKIVEKNHSDDLFKKIQKLEFSGKEDLEKKARDILAAAIQRYAGSHAAELTTTTLTLPSDDLKGKIIGKEGRNIRTLERLTGVEIIIDETPETLMISGFDPVRRQIAKIALEKLMVDGRIQPARIEETVEKAKEEITTKIKEAGDQACYECAVTGIDPRLSYLLGRLKYRTSYGQNVLLHSVEMAHIAGIMAKELGADVGAAKMGALFHDIGKAVDHEVSGTHVEIGRNILKKFNVKEEVIEAMQSHHEEYPYATLESRIVQAADAISGGRPGARRDTAELFLKRLEDLEKIANSFPGVEKSYAIAAGRDLRVFVKSTEIDDLGAKRMARDIALRIEQEMQYPGEIKINVIRETRIIEYAR